MGNAGPSRNSVTVRICVNLSTMAICPLFGKRVILIKVKSRQI